MSMHIMKRVILYHRRNVPREERPFSVVHIMLELAVILLAEAIHIRGI